MSEAVTTTTTTTTTATSQARKRRMNRRSAAAGVGVEVSNDFHEEEQHDVAPSKRTKKNKLSVDALAKIPGVKKQARYVPAVDPEVVAKMSREELTLWRKEARRVRNRESAAASRQKTQSRISELEAQVAALNSKYHAALERICELEQEKQHQQTNHRQEYHQDASLWMPAKMALHRQSEAVTTASVSPPLSPRDASICSGSMVTSSSTSSSPVVHQHDHQRDLPSWSLNNPQESDYSHDHCHQDCASLTLPFSSHVYSPSSSSTSTTDSFKYQQRHNPKISRPNACVQNPFPTITNRAVVIAQH